MLSLSFLGLLLSWTPVLHAQNAPTVQSAPLKAIPHWRFPLISHSTRDGLLIGFDLRLTVGSPWEPNIGAVLGLPSYAIHYRYGLTVAELISLDYHDWPGSSVLGREGERGLQIVLNPHGLALRGFYGTLWHTPRESQDPAAGYLHASDRLQWELPLGARLALQGELLIGALLTAPMAEFFRTFSGSAQLTLDQTTLQLQYGQLANPAGLADLRFRFSLRSYPATLQGDRFLVASLERRFDLFTGYFSSDLILRAEGEIFFEGGEVWLSGASQGGVLSGWGVGLVLPDLDLRLDAAFNAQGELRLHLQSSLVEF